LVATLNAIAARDPNDAPDVLHLLAERMLRRLTDQEAELTGLQRQAGELRSTLTAWDGAAGGQGAAFWRKSLAATQAQQQAVLREIIARLERGAASAASPDPTAPGNRR
jgi:hypothetical protein